MTLNSQQEDGLLPAGLGSVKEVMYQHGVNSVIQII